VAIAAFRIDSPLPVVALTGSRRPVLFVAGCVLDRCETRLLAAMTAHETGHRRAADNLKRLLLSACVDPLGFSPAGRTIAAAWESAAEEAADDDAVAAGTSPADLAEALVFVARLSPHGAWPVVPAAAFYAGGTLERRVRRLIENPESHRDVTRPLRGRRIAAALLVAAAWLLAAEALHRPMYRLVESAVHHSHHQLRGLVVDRPRA
jgi:beta-lactamase regulating signal transducer with metallopeptidase domain